MLSTFRRSILDRLILRPTRDPLDAGAQLRVGLAVGGRTLESFLYRVSEGRVVELAHHAAAEPLTLAQIESQYPRPRLLVLKFPGTAGRGERSTAFPLVRSRTNLATAVNTPNEGEVWTWNPPGYGTSAGRTRLANLARSAASFVEQIATHRATDATQLLLTGNSLGCVTALAVAAKLQTAKSQSIVADCFQSRGGLLLRNAPDLAAVVLNIARRYPGGHFMRSVTKSLPMEMNTIRTAQSVHRPAMFMQCERDSLVPPKIQATVQQAYAGPLRVVTLQGLDHDGLATDDHEPAIQDGLAWLFEQMRS